jgi:hypothetical protein
MSAEQADPWVFAPCLRHFAQGAIELVLLTASRLLFARRCARLSILWAIRAEGAAAEGGESVSGADR